MSAMVPSVSVPEELAVVPPGAVLAGILEEIDVELVSGYDTVEVLLAEYRLLCRQQARFYRAVLETGLRRPFSIGTVERVDRPGEFACEEARAALVWSRARAERTLGFAVEVFHRLPVLGAAMLAGELDEPRAGAFAEWTTGLSDAQAGQVCRLLLAEAPRLVVGELVDRIKRACLAIDPHWAKKRYCEAVKTRRVVGSRNPDGTANLGGYSQPLDRVAAACERIDTLARACKRAGDARPIDHIRSDLYLGMTDGTYQGLTDNEIIEHVLAHPYTDPDDDTGPDGEGGGEPGGPPEPGGGDEAGAQTCERAGTPESCDSAPRAAGSWAVPEIRVELSTLLGVNEHPAEIPPWGHVPASQARELVAAMHSAQWRYVLCDPHGRAVGGGLLRARPTVPAGERARRDRRRGGIVEIAVTSGDLALAQVSDAPRPTNTAWAAVLVEISHAAAQTDTGEAHSDSTDRRVPGAGLRRWLQLRDRKCVHPCCRVPAVKADQDHRIDYAAGGPTTGANLSSPCRHDHRLKHDGHWTIDQPEPGLTIWTSPLGHPYESRPPPVIPRLPEPLPDGGGDRYTADGWLVWPSGPAACECPAQCDRDPPLLPPAPIRVPDPKPEDEHEPEAAPIFDPNDKPPF